MTREEAITTLKDNICGSCYYFSCSNGIDSCYIQGCNNREAIKALEQEPCEDAVGMVEELGFVQPKKTVGKLISVEVLDKIRAEVAALPKTYPFVNHIDMYIKEDDVKKIIDKYKAESEEI